MPYKDPDKNREASDGNELANAYTTEANAQAALVALLTPLGIVIQPPSD